MLRPTPGQALPRSRALQGELWAAVKTHRSEPTKAGPAEGKPAGSVEVAGLGLHAEEAGSGVTRGPIRMASQAEAT